jgi:hypothetical protein
LSRRGKRKKSLARVTCKACGLEFEVVHHINGVKSDNRPENLEVMTRGSHSIHHREVEKEVARLRSENEALRAEVVALRSRLSGSLEIGCNTSLS